MTPSVTEYHFFFLAHEAGELPPPAEPKSLAPVQILRMLLDYLKKGRLQVLTLCLSEQFPSAGSRLDHHELSTGLLPERPTSPRQALGLGLKLVQSARPTWVRKNSWRNLKNCTLQPGPHTTRIFIRTGDETDDAGTVLIHGTLGSLPGSALVDSMIGRQLMRILGGVLPGDNSRSDLQLRMGSGAHIELMNSQRGDSELQPLIVVEATAAGQ